MDTSQRKRDIFNEAACERCGECFTRCPELRLPPEKAKTEIAALIEGKTDGAVLAHCSTCFSCNHYCPNDCNPYQLILERWNDLYKKRKAPPIYRFVCPTMDGNIWHMLEALLAPEEAAWIQQWAPQKPQGDLFLIGNYVHLFPFVVGNSRILDYFTPVDLIDHWECGAYLYQGGYLDVVEAIGRKCRNDFKKWNVKRIVPLIDAVHWMLTHVLPQEMGVSMDFEVVHFHQWLVDAIVSGSIPVKKPLEMTVTVHDNCYSKGGGEAYWEPPRKVLELCGCRIVEMEHNRENSLCCGFGAGASWIRPITILYDIMDGARRKLEEAEQTGAKALVSYCGGCLYLMWAAKVLYDKQIDVFHLFEIQRMAMGEAIEYPEAHHRRAWDIIAIITVHSFLSLIGRPFRIRTDTLDHYPLQPKSFRLLKIIRRILGIQVVQTLYKRIFRFLVPILKSKRPQP